MHRSHLNYNSSQENNHARVGDEGILGFKVEINGQFLPIKTFKEDGKLIGVIDGAKLTIGETKIIELNSVLKVCDNPGLESSLIVQE